MLRVILFIGLALHIAVAYWNGFHGPSLGAEGDALAFHYEALLQQRDLSQFRYETGWVYSSFLAVAYRLFSDHIFFGSMLSVGAWFGAALLSLKFMEELRVPYVNKCWAMLTISVLPTVLFNTAVTLREAYQLFFVTWMTLSAFRIIFMGRPVYLSFALAAIGAGMLHGALIVYAALMLALIFYYGGLAGRSRFRVSRFVVMAVIGSVGLVAVFSIFGTIAYNFDAGVVGAIEGYNQGAIGANARADYRTDIDLSSYFDLLIFVPRAFLQYWLEPIPGKIANVADAALFLENLFRAFLIVLAIRNWRRNEGQRAAMCGFLIIALLGLEFIWSFGTVNWGTAARHHVPGIAILVIVAMAGRSAVARQKPASRGVQAGFAPAPAAR